MAGMVDWERDKTPNNLPEVTDHPGPRVLTLAVALQGSAKPRRCAPARREASGMVARRHTRFQAQFLESIEPREVSATKQNH